MEAGVGGAGGDDVAVAVAEGMARQVADGEHQQTAQRAVEAAFVAGMPLVAEGYLVFLQIDDGTAAALLTALYDSTLI